MSNSKQISHNDSNETRIALLEQSIGHIGQTLIKIESSLEKIDKKIDAVEIKLGSRIDKIDTRQWQLMMLVSGSILGLIVGKIFHWI